LISKNTIRADVRWGGDILEKVVEPSPSSGGCIPTPDLENSD